MTSLVQREGPGVEIATQELLSNRCDRIGTASDVDEETIVAELSTANSDVMAVVMHVCSKLFEFRLNGGRWVVPALIEEFQDPLISLRQPVGVLPHISKTVREQHNDRVEYHPTHHYWFYPLHNRAISHQHKELYCSDLLSVVGITSGRCPDGKTRTPVGDRPRQNCEPMWEHRPAGSGQVRCPKP